MNINNFFDGPFFDGPFFDAGIPDITGGGSHPSQGYSGHEVQRRTREDVERARERFGIEGRVQKIIQDVAAQQVARLETDAQKQYDELIRELELRRIEFEARYLEALSTEREKLLDAEIAMRIMTRLKQDQQERDILMLLVVAAAAS